MRGLDTVLIAPKVNVSWLARADRVDNYPGLPEVSGENLLKAFEEQAASMGAETHARHGAPDLTDGRWLYCCWLENDVVEAKTVVLTTGAANPKLLPGEEALIGAGVSYCATCGTATFIKASPLAVLSEKRSGSGRKPNFCTASSVIWITIR